MTIEMPEGNWKYIPKSIGYYISDEGKVVRILNGQIRTLKLGSHRGYFRANIRYKGPEKRMKPELIQRLMLIAFVGEPPLGAEAAHLNGDRQDNRIQNLKWCSSKENNSHKKAHGTYLYGSLVPTSKLTDRHVKQIKVLASMGFFHREIGRVFKINQSNVTRIINGERWVNAAP